MSRSVKISSHFVERVCVSRSMLGSSCCKYWAHRTLVPLSGSAKTVEEKAHLRPLCSRVGTASQVSMLPSRPQALSPQPMSPHAGVVLMCCQRMPIAHKYMLEPPHTWLALCYFSQLDQIPSSHYTQLLKQNNAFSHQETRRCRRLDMASHPRRSLCGLWWCPLRVSVDAARQEVGRD
jgi:hypothetical protein